MSSVRNSSLAERPSFIAAQRLIGRTDNVPNHLETDVARGGHWSSASGATMARADGDEKSGTLTDAGNRQSHEFQKKPLRLNPEQYLPERHRKDLIVLHFTAGTSCESAYRSWTGDPHRVATAFGVDPDGSIAEFFPAECWAYHLGVKGTHRHDQRSIGIEIANVGPLKLALGDLGQLNWWPGNWGTRFCSLDEEERYRRSNFRGIDFFAAMPEIQQQAVGKLVNQLCERFSIPRVASPAARAGEFDPHVFDGYSGVATHTNFRRDKWDVGPAFNWDYLGF